MYRDYVEAIIRTYERMAPGHPRLSRLTPAALKHHCKDICRERFSRKDEIVLRTFFGQANNQREFVRLIEDCSAQRFKSLVGILKGETLDPKPEFSELLAWMFDVQPRPYNESTDYTKLARDPKGIQPIAGIANINNDEDEPSGDDVGMSTVKTKIAHGKKPQRKWLVTAIVILTLTSGALAVMLLSEKKTSGQCMYWAGDHFDSGECIKRGGDSVLAPLDPVRLRNFRRITDTTTINEGSIGKVWYGIKDKVWEFYTTEGRHPVDGKNLMRLTKRSFEKFRRSQNP